MIYHYTYDKFIEEAREFIKKANGKFNLCTYDFLDISYLKGYIKCSNHKAKTSNTNTTPNNISNQIEIEIESRTEENSSNSYSFEFNIIFSETYQLPVLYFLIYNDNTGEITSFTSYNESNPSQSDLIKFFEVSKENHPFTGRINEFLHLCKFNQLLNQLQSISDKEQEIHTILTFWFSIILQLFNIDIQTLFT